MMRDKNGEIFFSGKGDRSLVDVPNFGERLARLFGCEDLERRLVCTFEYGHPDYRNNEGVRDWLSGRNIPVEMVDIVNNLEKIDSYLLWPAPWNNIKCPINDKMYLWLRSALSASTQIGVEA